MWSVIVCLKGDANLSGPSFSILGPVPAHPLINGMECLDENLYFKSVNVTSFFFRDGVLPTQSKP